MLSQQLIAALGLWTLTAVAQTLDVVLRNNGFVAFADEFQQAGIVLTAVAGRRLIVYAPTDGALARNGGPLARREEETDILFNVANENAVTMDKRGILEARQTRPGGQCEEYVFETWLSNPEWVNLDGRNQSLIQKDVASTNQGVVFTGLGASVKITAADIPWDGGVVRPIAGVLTLPRSISETLPIINAARFLAELQRANILADLEARPNVTILAPTDAVFRNVSALTDAQLRQHILVNVPAYTPSIRNGDVFQTLAGTSVTATVRDDIIFIGGAQIQAGDAITINGVIHTVDRFLIAPAATTTGSPSPPLVTAGATTAHPFLHIWTWVAMAAAVGYHVL